MRVVWHEGLQAATPDLQVGDTIELVLDGCERGVYELVWIEPPLFTGEPIYVFRPSF
jgi:hypothetical protein